MLDGGEDLSRPCVTRCDGNGQKKIEKLCHINSSIIELRRQNILPLRLMDMDRKMKGAGIYPFAPVRHIEARLGERRVSSDSSASSRRCHQDSKPHENKAKGSLISQSSVVESDLTMERGDKRRISGPSQEGSRRTISEKD